MMLDKTYNKQLAASKTVFKDEEFHYYNNMCLNTISHIHGTVGNYFTGRRLGQLNVVCSCLQIFFLVPIEHQGDEG